MCGIAGYFKLNSNTLPDEQLIGRMVNIMRHRGPDEFGVYLDDNCVLGHARLSIIDLTSGSQPLCNEDGSLWIVYNGEVYNYIELREELKTAGHHFRTQSDTEVIVHAWEQWGRDCLDRFNGQFAFAIYDRNKRSLFVARDRLGIRPVFYTVHDGRFVFASEIKGIFCDPSIQPCLDYKGLDEIFTWWTTTPPRTAFERISELPAGSFLQIKEEQIESGRWWDMSFPTEFDRSRSSDSWAEELHELLVDAVRLRLRADVPVGAYLSGGLDSSATTALIRQFTDNRVETFSIAFQDKAYDESGYQREMADYLGTNHHQVSCTYQDIATNFPHVIRHAERPILRTAPTPLYMLSELVRGNNFKVVLTGEGADEIFGGYDLFKETLVRKFWSRQPDSEWRPLLLRKLYPTLPLSPGRARFYLETFYKAGLSESDAWLFSHQPRINTTVKLKDYFTDEAKQRIGDHDSLEAFGRDLPDQFQDWHHLLRAQFLEAKSLLSGYLLSSQGDRVSAANSVEGRYPFLDHRVVELGSRIPPWLKIRGLNEKAILKRAMKKELPPRIVERVKQPYMAPDSNSFFCEDPPAYVEEMLSEECLARTGLFKPEAVAKLRTKCARLSHAHLSFKDNMSFIGILSTQLLVQQFIDQSEKPTALEQNEFSVRYDYRSGVADSGRQNPGERHLPR
ncbi:MAG: asparagine synthase (glutamine-hydrolyzing) [candidate division Zixibacteria bacterium]|nr:asparagine synthase (glutamine-hydrolyzing) [candidate division Zixibacteria bacterium]MDH3936770.1 asparagine synthase (glutamine-hydrolyzing) [candidate division Zixibacteria bacterium]MDH4032778.1 asparagine synthase (glutamine-hydrolyzing) [candidate division Zixibacteria bacterium]